jgi:hypothetical protein
LERNAYLAGLAPGSGIDHRGATFTQPLLDTLLGAVRDPATGHPRFGPADFKSAAFQSYADFGSATFKSDAQFGAATFQASRPGRS